jgi:hypothetical protein
MMPEAADTHTLAPLSFRGGAGGAGRGRLDTFLTTRFDSREDDNDDDDD